MSVGVADLPLHAGKVPQWLANLMKRLSKSIIEMLVSEYGSGEVVKRLGDPYWFQALNNVIGMDWDSSGSTTVTLGILKEVSWNNSLGMLILGGKGGKARLVSREVEYAVEKLGLTSSMEEELKKASRLGAKVDSSLLQDGYQLYHHSLIVSDDGRWSIVQQGMNTMLKMARRYHWVSENLKSYVVEPHYAVASDNRGRVLNLVASEAEGARKTILDLAREPPSKTLNLLRGALAIIRGYKPLTSYIKVEGAFRESRLRIEHYRPVKITENLRRNLVKIREVYPKNLEELLLIEGVGPKTFRALALISDLVYGEPPSERDPVTDPFDPFLYSYAFGGKDGVPYPVNKARLEEVIKILEDAIEKAKLGRDDKLKALKRLHKLWRNIGGGGR